MFRLLFIVLADRWAEERSTGNNFLKREFYDDLKIKERTTAYQLFRVP